MNILQSLEAYTNAQKGLGTNFIILGVFLLIISAVFAFFVSKSQMATGLKCGALVAGVFIILGGFTYRNFSEKTKNDAITIYEKDATEFVQFEHERMEKVDKGFLTYQIVFAVFVLAALIVIVFIKSPLAKGIAFAIAILFIGQLLIEGFSHKSIREYTDILRTEVNK